MDLGQPLTGAATARRLRVAVANWRDLTHPEGGGSERYVQRVGGGLAARGHDITLLCAAHGNAPAHEVVDGVRLVRRGGRLGVYQAAARSRRVLEQSDGRFDVVVDVQNGVPFSTPLTWRGPVVNLVHHVHREQWPVVFSPAMARVGWFVESRVAPRLYRGRQYVAVSEQTRAELVELGVRCSDITVIHNGTDTPQATAEPRSDEPRLVVLGRLVPHKRVEHAVDVLARLLPQHPALRLTVVGEGWWHDEIVAHARTAGVLNRIDLVGFVSEAEKHRLLARSWVKLAPSVKEGWGLCVVEAGSHGVPTIAYRDAGGLSESVVDGTTGLLVEDFDALVGATDQLLRDADARQALGAAAREWAATFTWRRATDAWERLLLHTAAGGRPTERHDLDLASAEASLHSHRTHVAPVAVPRGTRRAGWLSRRS